MISLSEQVLTRPDDEVRQRHERYGAAAGHLTMIVYSGAADVPPGGDLFPHLAVYPVKGHPLLFPLLAVIAGLRHARRPVDLVTTQDPFATGLAGLILAWLLRAPLLAQNHSRCFDNPHWIAQNPRRHGIFNRLGRWVIRRAAMNRVVNPAERETYIALGVAPDRVRVIPLANPAAFAVPVPPEKLAAQRAAWGLDATHKIVLWVGRLVPLKQIPLLLAVMQRVIQQEPLARLVLVGDPASLPDLPAAITARGLDDVVILPGYSLHDDLPVAYQAADVYALTSVYEGMPRVVSEAGASGLPVVLMDLPGLDAVVLDGETGWIVPQGDMEAFADRVLALLRDRDQARAMGQRARDHVLAYFDSDRLFDEWMACWRDAAGM
jgi:glycosyltransferase involved in cell wall biosynthesis